MRTLNIITLSGVGGLERRFLSYASSLSRKGLFKEDAILLCSDDVHLAFREVLKKIPCELYFFKHFDFKKKPKIPKLFRYIRLRYLIKSKGIEKVVIWNEFGKHAQYLKSVAEIIYHESGSAFEATSVWEARNFISSLDRCVCNSRSTQSMMNHLGVPFRKMSMCQTVLRKDFSTEASAIKKVIDKEALRLGMLSSLSPRKAIPLVFHAINLLKKKQHKVHLTIAGEGPCRNDLETLISKMDLGAQVELVGNLNQPEEFFKKIHVFVMSSLGDAYPNSALEAQAMACPIIAPNIDGFADIVENAVSGILLDTMEDVSSLSKFNCSLKDIPKWNYFPESDTVEKIKYLLPSAISEAILTFIENSDKVELMSRAAQKAHLDRATFEEYSLNLKKNL